MTYPVVTAMHLAHELLLANGYVIMTDDVPGAAGCYYHPTWSQEARFRAMDSVRHGLVEVGWEPMDPDDHPESCKVWKKGAVGRLALFEGHVGFYHPLTLESRPCPRN